MFLIKIMVMKIFCIYFLNAFQINDICLLTNSNRCHSISEYSFSCDLNYCTTNKLACQSMSLWKLCIGKLSGQTEFESHMKRFVSFIKQINLKLVASNMKLKMIFFA